MLSLWVFIDAYRVYMYYEQPTFKVLFFSVAPVLSGGGLTGWKRTGAAQIRAVFRFFRARLPLNTYALPSNPLRPLPHVALPRCSTLPYNPDVTAQIMLRTQLYFVVLG